MKVFFHLLTLLPLLFLTTATPSDPTCYTLKQAGSYLELNVGVLIYREIALAADALAGHYDPRETKEYCWTSPNPNVRVYFRATNKLRNRSLFNARVRTRDVVTDILVGCRDFGGRVDVQGRMGTAEEFYWGFEVKPEWGSC